MHLKTLFILFLAVCTLGFSSCEDKEKIRTCRSDLYSSFTICSAVGDTLLKITDVRLNDSDDSLRVFDLTQKKIKEMDSKGIFVKAHKYMDNAYMTLTENKGDTTMQELYKVSKAIFDLVYTPHMIYNDLKKDLDKLKNREKELSSEFNKEHPASRINEDNINSDTRLFMNNTNE